MAKLSRPNHPLADVNVLRQQDGSYEIVACFMPDPDLVVGEGNSKGFLALDASLSLREMYGVSGPFMSKPNWVQAVARKIGAILCGTTRSGKVSGLYWAVSPEGDRVEGLGDFDEAGWSNVTINGPKTEKWGRGTKLLPAIRHGVETVGADADMTLGVILTDGLIEDEQACIEYCIQLDEEINQGKRKPCKLVLIGIGEDVDQMQLDRFDNLGETHGLKNDLWQAGLASSFENEADIMGVLYGELMSEEMIVAPNGRIEDGSGKQLAMYSDGMPGKVRFTVPAGANEFIIKIPPDHQIKQDFSEVLALV